MVWSTRQLARLAGTTVNTIRHYHRLGVPGATILGPLAIPTQFIAGILVAGGTSRSWVLLWQAVSISIWTTVGTVSIWVAIGLVAGF